MLSYFKLINKYYNLRNTNTNTNTNTNVNANSSVYVATNGQFHWLGLENVEKLNVENTGIVKDDEENSRVKENFCTIDFSC